MCHECELTAILFPRRLSLPTSTIERRWWATVSLRPKRKIYSFSYPCNWTGQCWRNDALATSLQRSRRSLYLRWLHWWLFAQGDYLPSLFYISAKLKHSDSISSFCTDLNEIFDFITDLRLNRLISLLMNDVRVRCPLEDLGCHCVKHLRLWEKWVLKEVDSF